MAARRIGRPLKAAEPGKRVSLGLKVTPGIKARINEAAQNNGRTQSQEAEYRLQRTFDEEPLEVLRGEVAALRRLIEAMVV